MAPTSVSTSALSEARVPNSSGMRVYYFKLEKKSVCKQKENAAWLLAEGDLRNHEMEESNPYSSLGSWSSNHSLPCSVRSALSHASIPTSMTIANMAMMTSGQRMFPMFFFALTKPCRRGTVAV